MIRNTLVIFLSLLFLTLIFRADKSEEFDENLSEIIDGELANFDLMIEQSTTGEEVITAPGIDDSNQSEPSDESAIIKSEFIILETEIATEETFAQLEDNLLIPSEMYLVTRVIDGDTIEVRTDAGVMRVRYIGVDTPETVHPSKPVECFGKEASNKNKELVEGKWVRLEKDISNTDSYGRWLRYVYVDDEFVNLTLVAEGYANVVTYPPDVKYIESFWIAERTAREARRGLWGDVCEEWVAPTAPPTNSAPATSQTPPSPQCNIKGNINSKKEKIYHYPGCKSYDQTIITEDTGERWFCSEAEAVEAGWRKAGNC